MGGTAAVDFDAPDSIGTGAAWSEWDQGAFFDPSIQEMSRARAQRLTPDEELMLAVVEQAVEEMKAPPSDRHLADAYWYIQSRERDWAFSFERICEHFGFCADAIRRRVKVPEAVTRRLEQEYPAPAQMEQRILHVLNHTFGAIGEMALHRQVGGHYPWMHQALIRMEMGGIVERSTIRKVICWRRTSRQ